MYMAPVVRATPVRSRPVQRLVVGAPVLLLAALAMLPWLVAYLLYAGVRFVIEAVAYAGQVALGR